MIIRTYNIICPSCHGTGFVPSYNGGVTGTTTDVCKACHGSGLVVVTETVFEPLTPFSTFGTQVPFTVSGLILDDNVIDCECEDGIWVEKLS